MRDETDGDKGHIVPYATLVIVWAALLTLTILTVAVSRIDLGMLNIWAALGIACSKSVLVISFFMHMKYENRLFKLFLMIALITLATFIGFTFFDVMYR
ncbi:cytochrome C oxidase subunit IV family protein [Geothermobacter hydrogeniphilus]|uniref:Cytochrome-c oxidase n=1 Tax=Geothermobacter hydrogeniphilus TaxID=1969733 RepID=A0A1X0Y3W3_9BACT|nr:cytochrome C oxidase subunit IV family protein [Geothermobacter hydrogeniphilus]ORJ59846.1 cytochrome-c oxidase [Geothermobacter hydrogeniphilus]